MPFQSPARRSQRNQSIHLLGLNQDIFQHIIPFLTRPALSQLSRTCRALHSALVENLLRGTVEIEIPLLDSFQEFLEPKNGRPRYDSLRHWKFVTLIHGWSLSDPNLFKKRVGEIVLLILRASCNLVSLSLNEVTAELYPPEDLRLALSGLTQLQELSLGGLGAKHEDVLKGILPNLHILRLDFSSDRLSPLNFVTHHRNTIQELTLNHIWPQRTFSSEATSEPFMSVRRLFANPIQSFRSLVTLARLFPNLETLSLSIVLLDEEWNQQGGFYEAIAHHDTHKDFGPLARWYDRTKASVQDQGGTWPKLRTLRMHDSVGLFWLPLCCPVERLEIRKASIMPEQMALVYANLYPRVLVLSQEDSADEFLEAVRCHVVPLEGAPSVTHLTVVLSPSVILSLSPDQVWSALRDALARSSVSHLLVEYSSPYAFGETEETTELYRDLEGGMQLFARNVPSLRNMFFDIEGRGLKAWELEDGEGGEWKAMSEWEARRVIQVEAMRDSGRDD